MWVSLHSLRAPSGAGVRREKPGPVCSEQSRALGHQHLLPTRLATIFIRWNAYNLTSEQLWINFTAPSLRKHAFLYKTSTEYMYIWLRYSPLRMHYFQLTISSSIESTLLARNYFTMWQMFYFFWTNWIFKKKYLNFAFKYFCSS